MRVNYNIQDGNALDEILGRNEAVLNSKGFPAENRTALQEKISDLTGKQDALNKLEKQLEDLTAEQNARMQSIQNLIKKIRIAASSAYGDDARTLKQFNVGIKKRIPNGINSLRFECEYLLPIVTAKSADLLKSGLQQEDKTALTEASESLVYADKVQEDAKKQKNEATIVRDEADKELKKIKTKIRNFVKSAFAGDNSMLVQFEPIPKARGASSSSKVEAKTPEEENPPAK